MKRKISIVTIFILILISMSGCSQKENPETTVTEFIEEMKEFNIEEMASKVNPEDWDENDEVLDLKEAEEDEFMKYFLDYMKSNAKKITYEIEETEIEDENAVVKVEFNYIDGGPLFKATFKEYIEEAFSLMLTEDELTDEENAELFVSIMKEKNELIEETFVDKIIDIKCIKIEDEWYIDGLSDELLDVAMSNILSVAEELDDSFDLKSESDSVVERSKLDDVNLIEKGIGDEIELSTINMKITDVEEVSKLTPTHGPETIAKEGTKFVVVGLEVTNKTKSGFDMSPDVNLVDNEEREFKVYSESIGSIDDYMDYRELSPSITESGYFVYELPEDAKAYSMFIEKSETDDIYKIVLQ